MTKKKLTGQKTNNEKIKKTEPTQSGQNCHQRFSFQSNHSKKYFKILEKPYLKNFKNIFIKPDKNIFKHFKSLKTYETPNKHVCKF